jgi:hypothetical protein
MTDDTNTEEWLAEIEANLAAVTFNGEPLPKLFEDVPYSGVAPGSITTFYRYVPTFRRGVGYHPSLRAACALKLLQLQQVAAEADDQS